MKAVVLAIVLLGGCSFVFVSGPQPNRAPLEEPDCTKVPVVPLLDGVAALGNTIGVIAMIADWPDATRGAGGPFGPAVGYALIAGWMIFPLVEWSAAIYGFVKVKRCHAAYRDYWSAASQGR